MIDHRIGDATEPVGDGAKIIVHVCNDIGGWGRGFVLALSARWPEPEQAYLRWHAGRGSNDFELGAIQLVSVEDDIWVANLIGQHDIIAGSDGPPVRYDAIEAGLAGGEWNQIEAIIERTLGLRRISVTVYDLA